MKRNQRWIILAAMTLVFATGCSPGIGPIDLSGDFSLDIPFAVPGGPYVGVAGQPVQFDGSGSSDPEGHALTYDWSFGDGGTSTLAMPTHTYLASGSYTVTLRVCDNSGCNINEGSTSAEITAAAMVAGGEPRALAIRDFDGDSIPDVVALHVGGPGATGFFLEGSNVVSVLLGNGDGTFQDRVNYPVDQRPRTVDVADLNDDDILDLVVANSTSNNVSVLLGNGDGSFQGQQLFPAGSQLLVAAVSDINSDTIFDIITANQTAEVCLLLGDGDGTFRVPQCLVTPGDPKFVAAVDLDADGDTDLLTANGFELEVLVFLGDGNGTFAPPLPVPTNGVPFSVAVNDLNGDGAADIISASGSFNHVSVMLGNGDGTFQETELFPVNNRPISIATATFDADTTIDLVSVSDALDNFKILLGDGRTFLSNQPFSLLTDISNNPRAVASADLNSDGIPDVVTANSGQAAADVSVFLGNGDGTFQAEQRFPIGD